MCSYHKNLFCLRFQCSTGRENKTRKYPGKIDRSKLFCKIDVSIKAGASEKTLLQKHSEPLLLTVLHR